jgi:hypothetical protein
MKAVSLILALILFLAALAVLIGAGFPLLLVAAWQARKRWAGSTD